MIRIVLLHVLCLGLLGLSACQSQQEPETMAEPPIGEAPVEASLQPTDAPDAIAAFLVDVRARNAPSRALAQVFPDLDRETAYQVQHLTMQMEQGTDNQRLGWKMGGARVATPDAVPDPSYGYSLASHRFEDGAVIADSLFVNGMPQVEAEIAVWIGADLPGPTVSREELEAAVEGVSGAVEFISQRMLPATEGGTLPTAHAIADNLSHAGVILGATKVPLAGIDMGEEVAYTEIDGVEQARGDGGQIMGGDPLDAVLWLANELPKHGMALRAGDFVITGSVYDNPTMQADQEAAVHFSTLGTIRVSLR